MKILSKFKAVALCVIALFLYLFGYRKGKSNEKIKIVKGTVHAIKNAKTSRNSLANPDRVKRLHNKYKR